MRSLRTAFAAIGLLSSLAAAQQYVISTYAGGAPPLAAPVPGNQRLDRSAYQCCDGREGQHLFRKSRSQCRFQAGSKRGPDADRGKL